MHASTVSIFLFYRTSSTKPIPFKMKFIVYRSFAGLNRAVAAAFACAFAMNLEFCRTCFRCDAKIISGNYSNRERINSLPSWPPPPPPPLSFYRWLTLGAKKQQQPSILINSIRFKAHRRACKLVDISGFWLCPNICSVSISFWCSSAQCASQWNLSTTLSSPSLVCSPNTSAFWLVTVLRCCCYFVVLCLWTH